MRKFAILALAGAFAVCGAAETVTPAAAAEGQPAPRSLDQVRQSALSAMYAGDLQIVARNRMTGRRWRGGRSYRGHRGWRGRSVYRGRGYYGRRYYGPRRYYGRRHYRPGIYFGIR